MSRNILKDKRDPNHQKPIQLKQIDKNEFSAKI